mgnify:CR=1 FL=1
MSDAVIRNEASKLSQHNDVAMMVKSIISSRNKKQYVKEVSTKERIENELWKIVDDEDNNTHRLRALEMMGKSIAMFSEVVVSKRLAFLLHTQQKGLIKVSDKYLLQYPTTPVRFWKMASIH